MKSKVAEFYEPLAEVYHLIFADWDASIVRQALVLDRLLKSELGNRDLRVLDCACGIGTQAMGLAQLGHLVTGSDVCSAAIERARREAQRRGLAIPFYTSDMTALNEIAEVHFDAVVALDNALPHLERDELRAAARAMSSKLGPGGVIVASMRDYDRLIAEKPTIQGPTFYGSDSDRRIVHQIWDWIDDDRYRVHLYITVRQGAGWQAHHFVGEYRAVLRCELSEALEKAGFRELRWIEPEESGFYQPMVMARKDGQREAAEKPAARIG